MTREKFYSLPYQEQWFHLVEWTVERYKRNPYLYYALHVITQAYEHSRYFDASVIKDLHYDFD